ncbi:MAG: hypothetical protein NT141_01390 [candidate division WWE3 bacterium]|nr:hypothetical protein [candidate division WWE3 bacterium]
MYRQIKPENLVDELREFGKHKFWKLHVSFVPYNKVGAKKLLELKAAGNFVSADPETWGQIAIYANYGAYQTKQSLTLIVSTTQTEYSLAMWEVISRDLSSIIEVVAVDVFFPNNS